MTLLSLNDVMEEMETDKDMERDLTGYQFCLAHSV